MKLTGRVAQVIQEQSVSHGIRNDRASIRLFDAETDDEIGLLKLYNCEGLKIGQDVTVTIKGVK